MSDVNRTPRILVVDDDLVLGLYHAQILLDAGFEVDTAEDGDAGWRAIGANQYDLVITDNNMPKVTGIELAKRLRCEGHELAVILVSGALPAEEIKRNPWLRLSAAMAKPFTAAQLLATVKLALQDGATLDPRQKSRRIPVEVIR